MLPSQTVVLVLAGLLAAAPAAAQVGVQTILVADSSGPPIETTVWYPTSMPASSLDRDSWVLEAVADAPPIPGRRRLVVISHGMTGSSLAHHDLAEQLARRGAVVAAPLHPGDNWRDGSLAMSAAILAARPRQLSRAIDGVLADRASAALVDPARIAAIGYSMGGYTALVAAGGRPDARRFAEYCRAQADDALLCGAGAPRDAASIPAAADGRIRALVLMAPALGFLFDRAGLKDVTIPVQLFRAGRDEVVRHPWNEERIAGALAKPPDYALIEGAGHYVFLAPCPPRLAWDICADAPGIDRRAIHAQLNREIAEFLERALPD